jgi:type IV secretion system protein VirB9
MRSLLFLLLMLGVCEAGVAQIRPRQAADDPRVQIVDYDPNHTVQLHTALGYHLFLQFSNGEQIENVAVGDSSGWEIVLNGGSDRLFIRPKQPAGVTDMTVITSERVYNFELVAQPSMTLDMPYVVRFEYPAASAQGGRKGADAQKPRSRYDEYKITGDPKLRPSMVSQDGKRTRIKWPADRPIPAVYQITDTGEQALTNGVMRGDEFVIDAVISRLVFKIDNAVAFATRSTSRSDR